MTNKKAILPLTSDIVFKSIFARPGNEDILKALLEAILDIDIKTITVKNPEISKNIYDNKMGVLDIKAEINNNTIIDIEMQVENEKNIDSRSMFYTSSLLTESIKKGEDYKNIKRVIGINLLNYNYYKRNSYHNIAHMIFESTKKEKYVYMGYKEEDRIATKDIELHFIELPKFIKKNSEAETKIEQWLWLIIGREDKIKMGKNISKEIEKAMKQVKELSMNSQEWERYISRQKAIYAYNTGIRQAEDDGMQKGIKKGEKINSKKIAQKLLDKGLKLEEIVEITGLNKKEIEKISKPKAVI